MLFTDHFLLEKEMPHRAEKFTLHVKVVFFAGRQFFQSLNGFFDDGERAESAFPEDS